MIWQEFKVGVFIFALCGLAALSTVTIYERASGTMSSAWLLLPLFLLIAIAILVSELFFKKVRSSDPVQSNPASTAWPPALMPAMPAIVGLYILSWHPAPPQELSGAEFHPTKAHIVVTIWNQEKECIEQITYSLVRRDDYAISSD